jgi:hypothetical protein
VVLSCEGRHSLAFAFVILSSAVGGFTMSNIHSQTRDFGLNADRNAMPLTTFIGAALAILLTVFALGAAITGGNARSQDPAALSLIGP